MATAGNLVVNITGNNGPLKKTLGQTSGLIGRFAGSIVSTLGAIAIGTMITSSLTSALTTGVKLAAQAEQTAVAYKTLAGDAETAKRVISDLTQFAASTPFQQGEIFDAGRKLLAFGTAAGDVSTELRRIGDVSAGIGAPLGEIAEIYGKARVQGRLFMEDINQLTGRGIPIIGELAKQFGVTEAEVRNLVSSGQVNFGNLQQAFIDLTSEGGKFAGLMEAQSKTLGGVWSTFTDNVSIGLMKVGAGLADLMKFREFLSIGIALLGWTLEWMNANQGLVTVLGHLARAAFLVATAMLSVRLAVIAYAAAQKLAITYAAVFQAVLNPANILKFAAAVTATALTLGYLETQMSGMHGEAEKTAKAVAGIHQAGRGAGGMSGSSEFTELQALNDKYDQHLSRIRQLANARRDLPELGEKLSAAELPAMQAGIAEVIAEFDRMGESTTKNGTLLDAFKAKLAEVRAGIYGLSVEDSQALEQGWLDAIAKVSGVDQMIASARQELGKLNGTISDIDLAVDKAFAAGALPEQVAELQKLLQEIEATKAMERQRSEMDSWRKDMENLGKSIAEQFRTPAEVLADRLKELRELADGGFINDETLARAIAGAEQQFADATKNNENNVAAEDKTKPSGPGTSAALARGSAEAFSAILRAQGGSKSPNAKLEGIAKQQLDQNKQQTVALKQIASSANGDDAELGRSIEVTEVDLI